MLAVLAAFAVGTAWADSTSTLTFTAACGGSGTADDGVKWTVASDGTESTYDNTKGIHYGTTNAEVTYITLSTSDISGTITKVVVNASVASGVTATVDVAVGGSAFGGDAQSLTTSASNYTFNGSASGEIVVTVTKPSKATKAIYVKSIAVTYTTSGGGGSEVISYDKSSVEVTYGEEASVEWPVLSNPGNVEVIFESSDEAVATVDNEGNVTLNKPGTTTITATDGDDNDAEFEITYKKANPNLSYETASYTVKPNESFATPTLTNLLNVTGIVYSSTNTAVATVDAGTGAVTIGSSEGETTIKAELTENDYYEGSSATYKITVDNFNPNVAGKWVPITSTSDLVDGHYYIIVNATGDKALSTTQNNSNRSAVSVTSNDGVILLDEDADVAAIQLKTGARSQYWNLKTEMGYLYAASSSANHLKTQAETEDNTEAAISLDGGVMTLTFQGKYTRNTMRFNPNNGSPIFACYASSSTTGTTVMLYKRVTSETITVGEAGYTTYVTGNDFTFPSGTTAYIASAVSSNNVTLTEVASAPAGTAVVIKAAAGSYTINTITDSPADCSSNLLKASDGTVTGDGATKFALGKKSTVGFYLVGDDVEIPFGKAYLVVGGSGVKEFLSFDFNNQTAVEAVKTAAENGVIFNLAGQRVNKAQKGIFIVNGKKVVK